jgi:VWFA-related protein
MLTQGVPMSKWISLLCSAGLVAAQVQPVHHAGARLITVDVLARNDKGAVKGLSKEDFTLMDKGKNQPIAVFSITDAAGASGAKTEPLPENVASNRMNKSGEVARTATVILFDRLNIPFSYDLATVRSKTLEMLGSLRPTDRVGFYSLGTTLKMVQDFDQAPVKIVESAKRLSDGGTGSDAGARELDAAITDALMPIEQQSTLVRSNGTQRALRTIARHLAGIPGRKNLIWILSSPPLDYDRCGESAARL